MSRKSKETHGVQVFPFLAVLVCTMGSLIFLLLLTTWQVRQRTIAYAAYLKEQQQLAAEQAIKSPPLAEPEPEPEKKTITPIVVIPPQPRREPKTRRIPDQSYELALAQRERELSDLKAKWQRRVNQLAEERKRHLATVVERKTMIDASLKQASSLQSEVGKLEAKLGQLAGESVAASAQLTDETERLLIEKQLLELKKRLRAAQLAEATSENEKFQVVPFDPITGTTRRPIFIECTASGIRFQPEDILITAADLEGFTPRANPLAAGAGALINYWSAWNSKQRDPRSQPEPYPLLLVRPGGIFAYYVAIRMLEPIRTAHGYELIEESMALRLPDVDPGAQTACRTAVQHLIAQRELVSRAAVNSGAGNTLFGSSVRRSGGGGGNGGGGNGGSVIGGGTGSGTGGGGIGRGWGAAKGSSSNNPGDLQSAGGSSFTMNDVTGNDNSVGSRSWERIENFEGQPRRRRSGELSDPSDVFSPGNADGNPNGSDGNGTGRASGIGSRSSGGSGSAGDVTSGSQSNDGNLASGEASKSTLRTGQPGTSGTGGDSMSSISADSQGISGSGGTGGGPGGKTGRRGSLASNGLPSNGFGTGGGEPEPGMPIGQRPGKKRTPATQISDGTGQTAASGDENASGGNTGSSGSGTSSSSNQESDSSTASGGNSTPPRRLNGTKSLNLFNDSNGKSTKSKFHEVDKLEPEMLAGRRWGFCESGASIGFEREVRVDVAEDKLVIAEKYVVPLVQDESKQETFEHFVSSLDKYSREWGRPPQGFFWTPRLKFVVNPKANGHYEQLNTMMTRAGLATSHEFAKNSDTVEFGREPPATTKTPSKTASAQNQGGIR